jgi:hypothetical protein
MPESLDRVVKGLKAPYYNPHSVKNITDNCVAYSVKNITDNCVCLDFVFMVSQLFYLLE